MNLPMPPPSTQQPDETRGGRAANKLAGLEARHEELLGRIDELNEQILQALSDTAKPAEAA